MKVFGIKVRSVFIYVWLVFLAVTVLVSARNAYRKALNTEEFAYACDQFGYLRMAKEIRTAAKQGTVPEFKLESPQTRLLINFMKEHKVPLPDWEEVVAPHAHHFFPKSDYVGVQYPPGTGLTLALFPEGQAVYRLNRTVVAFFALVGIGALVLAGWKQAWVSASLVTLAIHLGLSVLGKMGALSFSINAALIPLLLSCLLTILALLLKAKNKHGLALIAAFAGGVVLGFGTLIRLPVVFLTPGFLVLLWPKTWKPGIKSLPIFFGLGVFLAGIVPVVINQHAVAGAWYLSTYASIDAALPTLERVGHNFSYFFGDGPAAEDNWALRDALIGFIGFVLCLYVGLRQYSNSWPANWKRVALAGLVTWSLSSAFFLTHWIVGPHYAIPGIFVTVALVALGSFALELYSTESSQPRLRNPVLWIALALVVWPGVNSLNSAWSERAHTPAPTTPVAHTPIALPPELADERAWIWADLLTGSLWYYANKPAYKIQFTNRETRAKMFRFVYDRGEPQYLIQDSGQMQTYIDEIEALGGHVEMKGKIDGHNPYFLIHWPTDGPAMATLADNTK